MNLEIEDYLGDKVPRVNLDCMIQILMRFLSETLGFKGI